jgi:hypothetical protein
MHLSARHGLVTILLLFLLLLFQMRPGAPCFIATRLPVPAIEIKFLNHFGILEGQFATGVIAKLLSGEIRTNGNPFNDFEKLCALTVNLSR